MRNYLFNKTFNSLSKSFYGVDATYAQSLQALWMIAVLILMCVINASASASLILVFFRQKPEGFIFYLFVLVVLGVILGSLWNVLSNFSKKKSTWKSIQANVGTFILSYFLLIFSVGSLVFKINYINRFNSFEDLVLIYRNLTTSDLFLAFFILILQVLLIAHIITQRRLVLDSFMAKKYERKVREYDIFNDFLEVELKSMRRTTSSINNLAFLKNSNSDNKNVVEWESNNFPEIDFLKATNNNKYNIPFIKDYKRILYGERVEGLKQQIRIFQFIEHELVNHIKPAHDIFNQFLSNIKRINPDILDASTDFSVPGYSTLTEMSNIVNANLDYSRLILRSMSEVINCDPEKIGKTKVNLQEFISNEFKSFDFNGKQVSLHLNFDDSENADIDVKQFKILLKNIFNNALRHGFLDERDYSIGFNISRSEEFMSLEIINNGKKLTEGFNEEYFISPLKKLGPTGNTGIGGYLIYLVIKNHGGDLIISDCSPVYPEYNVSFLIKLPLKNSHNDQSFTD
jgi:signal transduction histidine kinase